VSEVASSVPPSDRPTALPSDLKSTLLPELRALFAAEDFETALPMAESLLEANADPELVALVDVCRTKLADHYALRLGRLARVPQLRVRPNEWMTLDLDHRSCFVLVHVDGLSSLDMILDLSGMPRHETLRLLCDLLERGVIEL
jgi:hypothetical protein